MIISLNHYLVLAAFLFCIGVAGVLTRKNAIIILASIELMLNAVNLTFVAFARHWGDVSGQIFVFFSMVVAAAVITPSGDPLTLLMLAIPLYVLYELSILAIRFILRK